MKLGMDRTALGHLDMNPIKEFTNKKTIIVGEVNSGKTVYLKDILEKFLEEGYTDLVVIDMAPENIRGIGGKINLGKHHLIRYLTAGIVAPRLVGGAQDEIVVFAKKNALMIDQIFSRYLEDPSNVLFINDVSIYLQAGNIDRLLSFLDTIPTVIMNGYFGYSLGGGKFGMRERQEMKKLQEKCDRVINLKTL